MSLGLNYAFISWSTEAFYISSIDNCSKNNLKCQLLDINEYFFRDCNKSSNFSTFAVLNRYRLMASNEYCDMLGQWRHIIVVIATNIISGGKSYIMKLQLLKIINKHKCLISLTADVHKMSMKASRQTCVIKNQKNVIAVWPGHYESHRPNCMCAHRHFLFFA